MTLLEMYDELLRHKIADMKHGSEAGLVAIFGDDWETIGTAGQRRQFGREFKAAIQNGQFPELEWVRIENSGRFDVYRKKSDFWEGMA